MWSSFYDIYQFYDLFHELCASVYGRNLSFVMQNLNYFHTLDNIIIAEMFFMNIFFHSVNWNIFWIYLIYFKHFNYICFMLFFSWIMTFMFYLKCHSSDEIEAFLLWTWIIFVCVCLGLLLLLRKSLRMVEGLVLDAILTCEWIFSCYYFLEKVATGPVSLWSYLWSFWTCFLRPTLSWSL